MSLEQDQAAQQSSDNCMGVAQGWLDDPIHVSLGSDEPVPPGLQHRYMVVPAERKLAVLCRQIRLDLKE